MLQLTLICILAKPTALGLVGYGFDKSSFVRPKAGTPQHNTTPHNITPQHRHTTTLYYDTTPQHNTTLSHCNKPHHITIQHHILQSRQDFMRQDKNWEHKCKACLKTCRTQHSTHTHTHKINHPHRTNTHHTPHTIDPHLTHA